jgi:hypothetical protein
LAGVLASSGDDFWAERSLSFLFSARGVVDAAVWFGFQRHNKHALFPLLWSVRPQDRVTPEELDLDLSPQLNPVLRFNTHDSNQYP